MYIFLIVLILIACVLLVLAVLAQHPKSGMAANFGASNQVMGVRQTTDFLERFTWITSIAIVVLTLGATMASAPKNGGAGSKSVIEQNMQIPVQTPNQTLSVPINAQGDSVAK